MKWILSAILICSFSLAQAADKIKMYYNNEEISKIIEMYSKASGQKFVVDAGVRGKISIFQQEPVTLEEGFNQLSSALALNGFAISKQGDTLIVMSARNIQRSLIEVSTERPSLKPERMYSWIYNVKNIPADAINRDLRILISKDGEMSVLANTNQLIITDWVSNLNRVAETMKEVDKALDPSTAKLVASSKKERDLRKPEMPRHEPAHKGPPGPPPMAPPSEN
jgi:type II secretory pathway component GspD/PulD (secretin)